MQAARLALLAGVAALASPALAADEVAADFGVPTLDRWMYPFNSNPGGKLESPTFGAIGLDGFDDMDAQFIIGFGADGAVEPGLDPSLYNIRSLTVTAVIANDLVFEYDPTYDSYTTYLDETDPEFVADTDPGRAVTLYPLGYKPEWSLETFQENSPFGTAQIPPAQGGRNAFAQVFSDGEWVNASDHLKERFEAFPIAEGVTDAVAPGEFVPVNSLFTFEVDLCQPGVRGYLQDSLASGRINFAIASLQAATGDDGGPIGDPNYPIWYTKENPLAQLFDREATLSIEVLVGDIGDFNADGVKNVLDFVAYQTGFASGDPLADVDGNCQFNILDFVAFQQAFSD